MAPGLNYGVHSFEGMKAFRTADNRIAVFRPEQNAARMQHSSTYICVPPVPTEAFLNAVRLAVGLNAEYVPPHETGAAMYIRPLVFGSSAQLGLNPAEEYSFTVYVMPTGVYHGVHPIDGLVLEEFDRAAPKGTGSAKLGGNYAPVLPWTQKAYAAGYGITLHLDSQTASEIDEFSTSAFIGVRQEGENFTLVTPDSKNVIKSVTGNSACQIAEWLGWKVERRRVPYEELPEFSEVIAAGTAAALVPVKSITRQSRGDKFLYQGGSETPGPALVKLLDVYKGIQQGKTKDPFGWLDYVQEPSEWKAARKGVVNGDSSAKQSSIDMAA